MNGVPLWLAPHLPILLGLVMGTFAKYGLDLERGLAITRRNVVAHLMMLGFLGLIAEAFADLAHLVPTMRAASGGMAALLAARLVLILQTKGEAAAARKLDTLLDPEKPA